MSPREVRKKLVMEKVRTRRRVGWKLGKNKAELRKRETVIKGIIRI